MAILVDATNLGSIHQQDPNVEVSSVCDHDKLSDCNKGEAHLVSLKPLKLPVATNMARLTGAAMERQRKYCTAMRATSPSAFIAATQSTLYEEIVNVSIHLCLFD